MASKDNNSAPSSPNSGEDEELKQARINMVKRVVNLNQIKLWQPPYFEENVSNSVCLMETAMVLASESSLSEDDVLECLRVLQQRALENLQAKAELNTSGTIRLKLKFTKSLRNTASEASKSIEVKREADGDTLASRIAAILNLEPVNLRLISLGKVIKPSVSLLDQGIKPGSSVMVVQVDSSDNSLKVLKEQKDFLESTRSDAELLGEGDDDDIGAGLTIADQSGKAIKLPPEERKAIIIAMSLHEKGRAAMKKKNFNLALVLLLEAEQEYNNVRSELLQSVDNHGLLNLDIAWCYVKLNSISQLNDAVARLDACEKMLERAHGPNMERLVAVKGGTGSDKAMYMRMHLLQAIATYHNGDVHASKRLFEKAKGEFDDLDVSQELIDEIVAQGFSEREARIALRQCEGDVTRSAVWAQERKDELEKILSEEHERREKWKRYGKTASGKNVNLGYLKTLQNMGYSEDWAVTALKQTDNDINKAIDLIQNEPDLLDAAIMTAFEKEDKDSKTTQKSDEEGKSSKKARVSNDDKKLRADALKRMRKDIGSGFGQTDDHLDLTLEDERELFDKYLNVVRRS